MLVLPIIIFSSTTLSTLLAVSLILAVSSSLGILSILGVSFIGILSPSILPTSISSTSIPFTSILLAFSLGIGSSSGAIILSIRIIIVEYVFLPLYIGL